jgi:5-hydroxyisourate hydrolase
MAGLTTHVLDTMNGCPAAGMSVTLYRIEPQGLVELTRRQLGADGRAGGPLLTAAAMVPGRYRLVFEVAAYFKALGVKLPEPAFLDQVPIDFGIADAAAAYHVPLLASPWAYSTYRGS